MLGSFGHPTSNNGQQCPTMLAFVGINVGIVWPGLYIHRVFHNSVILGPDYMEADWPVRLMLYVKNCLGRRAHKAECANTILAWHVSQKEF